jgi:hypothetical protein
MIGLAEMPGTVAEIMQHHRLGPWDQAFALIATVLLQSLVKHESLLRNV